MSLRSWYLRKLHHRAIVHAMRWYDSLPRHLLGSFTKVDPVVLKATYASSRWIANTRHSSMDNRVQELLLLDLDSAASFLPVDVYQMARVEMYVWVHRGYGRGTDIPDSFSITKNSSNLDEFERLVYILDNPDMLPYWEIGLTDDDFIRSAITNDIDREMARSLYETVN